MIQTQSENQTVIRASGRHTAGKGTLPKKIVTLIFGAFLGAFVCMTATFILVEHIGLPFYQAFLAGLLSDIALNLAVHGLLSAFKNITPKIEFYKIFLMSLALAVPVYFGGLAIEGLTGLHYGIPLVAAVYGYAGLYLALVGLWVFVDDDFDEVYYQDLAEDYFDESTDKKAVGAFRAWIHSSRFKNTEGLFDRYYRPGSVALDLACGSCVWNTQGRPVIGVDINERMLRYGIKKGRLRSAIISDIYHSTFPGNSIDVLVCSQVLEHLHRYEEAVLEMKRILKPGGRLILEVPYDVLFGPYFFLFNIHCFIRGYWFDDSLYRNRCGHINHFSRTSIRKLLERHGFQIKEMYIFQAITLSCVAIKT